MHRSPLQSRSLETSARPRAQVGRARGFLRIWLRILSPVLAAASKEKWMPPRPGAVPVCPRSLGERERQGFAPPPQPCVGPQTQRFSSASQDSVRNMEMGTPTPSVCPKTDRAGAQPSRMHRGPTGDRRQLLPDDSLLSAIREVGEGRLSSPPPTSDLDSVTPRCRALNMTSLEQQAASRHLGTR